MQLGWSKQAGSLQKEPDSCLLLVFFFFFSIGCRHLELEQFNIRGLLTYWKMPPDLACTSIVGGSWAEAASRPGHALPTFQCLFSFM